MTSYVYLLCEENDWKNGPSGIPITVSIIHRGNFAQGNEFEQNQAKNENM